jgi:putative cofactor-binding repeat protein
MTGSDSGDETAERRERGATTRPRLLRTTGAAAVGAVGLAASTGAASAATLTVPADYPTVQAAVDAAGPGDEVVVTGGTYDGTLTVDVADLTVRTSSPRAATVSGSDSETGAAVSVEADGVTVAGFAVTNPGRLLGLKVQTGYEDVTVDGVHVSNVGPFTRLGTTGIIAGGGNDGLRIRDSVVENVASEFPDDESGYPTTNGIFLDDADGGYEDAAVTGNVVRGLAAETGALGILLQGALDGVAVSGNRVSNVEASNDRLPAEQEGTKFATYAQGVNVTADSTDDVTIRENVLGDIDADYFDGESVKVDGGAGGLTVEYNDLVAPVGIGNATATTVTANCNYWGHPKGPREVDGNLAAADGPNRQGRSAYFGPVAAESWLVRSVADGQNLQNACRGGSGNPGRGGGNPGRGN